METMKLVGLRIRKLRESRGLSQLDLSGQLGSGISNKMISNWEKGERSIGLDELKRISSFFGVTSDYLIGLSEFQTPEQRKAVDHYDWPVEISNDVFPYNAHAQGYLDYLFSVIGHGIIRWERKARSGYVRDSGICKLLEYFVALLDLLHGCKYEQKSDRDAERLLFELLDGFRDYVGDVVAKSFDDDEFGNLVRGRHEISSIRHDVYEALQGIRNL